jgi:formylglycine-generating enzyme required for sulfatase activity
MNRFDDDLRQAARSKTRTVIIASVAMLVLGVALTGYFLSFRSLSILVKPAPAQQIASISITNGTALALGKRIYSLSDQVTLRLSAPKYQDANLTVSAAHFGSELTVTMVPKPGTLHATVTPPTNVNWHLNDKFAAQSNTLERQLAPGSYQIAVKSDYHETVERQVTISAAEDTVIDIAIPVITGTLHAAMTPPGEIRIDGTTVDISRPIMLGPGPHNIALSADGYHPISETIIVQQDQRQFTRSYTLQPKPIQIRHQLNPKGGNLFINGKAYDISQSPLSVPYRSNLDIEYVKQGFAAKRQSQTVTPGETLSLSIALKPEFGDITVTANIVAEVYLDDQPVGPTPLQMSVPTLPAQLELRAAGYETAAKTITPAAGKPQSHKFTMITVRAAKLRDAKARYTSKSGIDMLFIQPNGARYSMGGARSEPGQRANEFIRQIALDRPFYVATHELTERQFYGKGSAMPLVNVTWEKVALYCNKLSQQEGLTPFYQTENGNITGFVAEADGYRLISEAEWEFLARAHKRPKQTIFPWGDDPVVPPKSGNLAGDKAKPASESYIAGYQDGFSAIAPAKSFPADQSGLYDMIGNVSEWTHDAYSFEPPRNSSVETDPLGRYSRGAHVIKGANFKSASRTELRAAFREGSDTPRDDVGFRLARYL